MKKLNQIFILIVMLLISATAFADWTLTPSKVSKAGHYIYWQILCTSDGNALSATNILSSTYIDETLLREIQGSTLLAMDLKPGTGGVIPNTTIDITLSNSKIDFFVHAGFAYDSDTPGIDIAEDYPTPPPILNQLKLALNDIGDEGDQVTLIILCWKESL